MYKLCKICIAQHILYTVITVIMVNTNAPSRVSPRRLLKTLRTNKEEGWDDILSDVLINTATPSITGLLHQLSKPSTTTNPQTTYVICNLRRWQWEGCGDTYNLWLSVFWTICNSCLLYMLWRLIIYI